MHFFQILSHRNESLFFFGCFSFAAALACLLLSVTNATMVQGAPAWYKPLKFCLSIGIFSWTMGWFSGYLPATFPHQVGNLLIISCLLFQIVYIGFQAGKGQLSHFNISSPGYAILYHLMALAATAVTIWVGYVGFVFFTHPFPELPAFYLWSIRLGIVVFVLFSFQGFAMGSRLSHTVGAADGGPGIPFLGWSIKAGDLRIAHFIGMHALQVVPLVAWFLLRNTASVLVFGSLWFLFALATCVLAFAGKSLFPG